MTFFSRALRVGILASALMMLNCQQLMDLLDESNKTDTTTANTNTDLDKAGSWTVLVYLDAANNLEAAGIGDVGEMRTAATGTGYNGNTVYVMMDRMNGYATTNTLPAPLNTDFFGTYIFQVVTGTGAISTAAFNTTVPNTGLPYWPTANDGSTANAETNMGHQKTLENFLVWGLNKAKADGTDYVYLDIWDHGAGWGGGAYGGNAVAWDDDSGHDALSIDEIRAAISSAQSQTGKKITIIGFDACYMGTIENAYSFKDYASIMIGSEEVEPGNGWAYDQWLPSGKVSPRTVATNVVTSFKNSYNGSGEQVTLAAYDLSKIDGFSTALESFLSKISTQPAAAISAARLNSQSFNNDLSVDFYDFVDKMNMPESAAVKNMINSMMVSEAHTTGGKVNGSHGVTVFFPQSSSNYDTSYDSTQFAIKTRWDDFISGKLASFAASNNEPGDATCGSEPNDTASKATSLTGPLSGCTGYIYTASDVDIYRFKVTGMSTSSQLSVTLSNIPAGADFDVMLFNTDVSASAPMAAAVMTGNTSQTFLIDLDSATVANKGRVYFNEVGTYCYPGDSTNTYMKQGWCYGQGINTATITSSGNFYLVVVGKNNSYSQVGKYSLQLSAVSATITTPP